MATSIDSRGKMTVVITGRQEEFLRPLTKLFKTVNWTDLPEGHTVLECEDADFSGLLVKLDILSAEADGGPPYTVWVPHSCVLLALDFSPLRAIGFHA